MRRAGAIALAAVLAVAAAGCSGGSGSSSSSKTETTRVQVIQQQPSAGGAKFDPISIYRNYAPGVVTIISVLPGGGGAARRDEARTRWGRASWWTRAATSPPTPTW